jgi:hypothetical protein
MFTKINEVWEMDSKRRLHDLTAMLDAQRLDSAMALARIFAIDATCELIGTEAEQLIATVSSAEVFGGLYKYRSGVTVRTEGLEFSVFPDVKIRRMDTGAIRNGTPKTDRGNCGRNGCISCNPPTESRRRAGTDSANRIPAYGPTTGGDGGSRESGKPH